MDEETTEPSIGLMPDEQPEIITTAMPVKMADDADVWRTADEPVEEPVYEQAEPGIQGLGLSSQDVDPNPFPGDLPQGMDDPLEKEFERPAIEAEDKYQKERYQWLKDGDEKVHKTIQNFDDFEPNEEPEVKELKIVQSLFKLDGMSEPQNPNDLEVKVGVYSLKHYNKEVNDYRELYSLAKDRSDKRVKAETVEADLQGAALMGLVNVGKFSDWVKSQDGMSKQRSQSLQYKYNDYQKQARKKYATEVGYVNTMVEVLKEGGMNAMLDYADRSKLEMSDDEYKNFKSLFKEVLLANPNTEMDDIINKTFNTDIEMLRGAGNFLGKNLRNISRAGGSAISMGLLPFKQVERTKEAWQTKKSVGSDLGWGQLELTSEDVKTKASKRLAVARRQAMLSDLSNTLKQDWAGIELNFERGGAGFWGGVEDKLGFIEENAYAMPSTVSSMLTYRIPYVGPLYTASMMYEATSNEYRRKLSDNGVPLNEAITISNKLGAIATVPNLLLEKFQSMGLTNKMPFVRPVVEKINKTVLRPYLRRGLNVAVGAGSEGLVELGQTVVTDMVQKLGAEFNEKIPGMDWMNGEDGVFDGIWAKYAASVVQVFPAGVGTMYSGISKEKRDKILKNTPRPVREMMGYTDQANDEIDAAETVGELSNAANRGNETRNPYSESAQRAVEREEAKAERERRAFSNLQKNGIVPIVRTDKTQPGIVEVVDPESGEILDRVDDARLAAESVFSYMELRDQANQDQMDELVNFIEAAILDVQDTVSKKGKTELELGSNIDVESIIAMYPKYQKRAEVQIDRLEQLTDKEIANGGDGGMSRAVYGVSVVQNEKDQKSFLQRIFGGKTSAMTLVHERGHAKFREALDSGAITLKEAYDFFIKLDKGLAGKRSRSGEKLRFMPEGTTETDYESIDEAVAEFHEVMLLRTRNGKKSKMRDVVGEQISAMVRSRVPGATKFKAFYDAMLDFFGKLLARNFYMKQAVKKGMISEAEIEAFRAALQGTVEQEMLDSDVESEASKILGDPFSIGDAEMKDTLYSMAYKKAKSPEKRLSIMSNFMERILDAKRELPKVIKAFGKDYEQAAIVDRRLMGDLRAEAAKMRRDAVEEAENAMYDRYGEVLSNEDLVQLKSQPVSKIVLAEGGIESLASAKRRRNDDDLKDGRYEDASGLPPIYYGGSQRPDQMAGQLFNEGLIKDDDVSTMMEAIDSEIVTVSNRKEDLKEARKFINDARKEAKIKSDEWLNERVAEQERDYNPMERARRVLVMMNAMRMSLPMELRGKISGDATLINIKSDEKRLEYLSNKLDKMDEVIESWIRKETTKEIEASFKRVLKLDPKSKFGKSKKTVADIHQQIKDIKQMSKMSKDAVDDRLNEIMVAMEDTSDNNKKEALQLEMVNLVGYGAMKDMSSLQLTTYLENVLSLEKKGMVLREIADQEFADRAAGRREFTNDEVTGGKGKMAPGESSKGVDYPKRSQIGKSILNLKNFHAHNLSFEWVLNGLSRRSKDTETLGGKIHRTFARMVHIATHAEKVANMRLNQDYDRFIGSVFGVKGSMALGNAIDKQLLTKHETGINRKWYPEGRDPVKKKMNASNIKAIIDGRADAEKLGLTDAEVESAKEDYYKKLSAKQAQKNMKGKVAVLNGNTKIYYETEVEGKDDELIISQSQAIAYTMMFRQEGMRESMIREGYTEETMQNLEDNFLTRESKLIREWMADKYEKNYDVVNAVFRKMNGVNLPMVDFYSPLKRIVDGEGHDIAIDGLGNPALTTSPSFTFGRVKNFAEMDREADALTIFNRHMIQTNHYVAWAETIKDLRAVFGNKDVRQNIRDYVGVGIIEIVDKRINNMADGGNQKAIQWAPLDKFRLAHTFTSLSYNIGVGIKQLTSVPAFAFDMGGADFIKYQARFFDNFKENLEEMWNTEYIQTRFKEGYERDVKDALRMEGTSQSQRMALAVMQKGMMVGKIGDIMPVIAGGWAAKHQAYDTFRRENPNSTKAEAEAHAKIVFEMTSDRYQQAVDQKDLSTFQGSGSLAKLFVMYLTSPNQYYAGVYESVLDWKAGRKGGRERAIRSIVIGHIILPAMFQLATDLWREVTDEEHEWKAEEYFRAMLLGPLNGLFLAGEGLSPLAAVITGSKVWDSRTPLHETINDFIRAFNKMSSGDFGDGVDGLLESAGQAYPTPVSFYPILKRRLKPFFDWD